MLLGRKRFWQICRQQAENLGKRLANRKSDKADVILASTSCRASETCKIAIKHCYNSFIYDEDEYTEFIGMTGDLSNPLDPIHDCHPDTFITPAGVYVLAAHQT